MEEKKDNKKSSWLKYKFDNAFAGGTKNQLISLLVIIVLIIVVFGIIVGVFLLDGNIVKGMGDTMKHIATPITISQELGAVSVPYFLIMIVVTLLGMAFYSAFIGIISNAIGAKMHELGKGHSKIMEEGHSVVIGFAGSIHTILKEMTESNENWNGNKKIIVVSSMEKEKMEDAVKSKKNLIFRSGDPVSEHTFDIASVEKARSIIVNVADDFEAVRVMLALSTYLKKADAYMNDAMPTISVLMHDKNCMSAAKIAAGVHHDFDDDEIDKFESRIRILYVDDILAHIFAQACRQPGLSWVISEICEYTGSEIYIEDKTGDGKALGEVFAGKSLNEINQSLEKSIALGVERNNRVIINPAPEEFRFDKGDRLIHLAEDDNEMVADFSKAATTIGQPATKSKDSVNDNFNFLVLGWSEPVPKIINEIDLYSAKGSRVTIFTESPSANITAKDNITVNIEKKNPFEWNSVMEFLDEHLLNCADKSARLTNIIVISDDTVSKALADQKSTITLLNIREYLKDKNLEHDVTVTTEMNLPSNQYLLAQANSNDFIVGSEIASRMLVQVANNPNLQNVFTELLQDEGSEFYLRPFDEYADITKPFNFNYLQQQAATHAKLGKDRQEIVVGWMRIGNNQANTIVKLNPVGAERNEEFKLKFANDSFDSYRLIVLAVD